VPMVDTVEGQFAAMEFGIGGSFAKLYEQQMLPLIIFYHCLQFQVRYIDFGNLLRANRGASQLVTLPEKYLHFPTQVCYYFIP